MPSLETKIRHHGSAFEMLYNAPTGPFPVPVKPEFSNWVDEQRAWRETAVLQDMSFHLTELCIEGPDVVAFLNSCAINSFENFGPMRAKQIVVCSHSGQYVGDGVATCEREGRVLIVGKPTIANWLIYHIENQSDYEVTVAYCDRPSTNILDRHLLRFQLQGPYAKQIVTSLNGGSDPEIKFFQMGKFSIGSVQVTALGHGMTGAPGYEFWGPSSSHQQVIDAIMEVGDPLGIERMGGRLYPVAATISGWISTALPAIYTEPSLSKYREWLPGDSFEAMTSIGGSAANGTLEDHYLSPHEMGYGFMAAKSGNFVGSDALRNKPQRKRVRLLWSQEDVADIFSHTGKSEGALKKIEMPMANYCTSPLDHVLDDGKNAGVSFFPVFSVQDQSWLSLGVIDQGLARDGQKLTVLWGEPNGGSKKPSVEPHEQKLVRVVVDTLSKSKH